MKATEAAVKFGSAMVTAKRHLSPAQFGNAVVLNKATIDNGWLGPEGSYGQPSSSGSLYGYGVSSDTPQY